MKRLLATDDAWALAVARLALGVVMFPHNLDHGAHGAAAVPAGTRYAQSVCARKRNSVEAIRCHSSAGAPERRDAVVRSRSHSNAEADSISLVQRQRQLPPAWPGTFIRASFPRLRRS
jgi:hypothetical protein